MSWKKILKSRFLEVNNLQVLRWGFDRNGEMFHAELDTVSAYPSVSCFRKRMRTIFLRTLLLENGGLWFLASSKMLKDHISDVRVGEVLAVSIAGIKDCVERLACWMNKDNKIGLEISVAESTSVVCSAIAWSEIASNVNSDFLLRLKTLNVGRWSESSR